MTCAREAREGFREEAADVQLLQWALGRWRGSQDLPTGLAESQGDLRISLRDLARLAGVERVACLRANGGLFCGKNDAGKEAYSQAVQKIAVAGRQAARRMGLGAIESFVLEGPGGSLVLAAGHSICGVQCGIEADPQQILSRIEPLVGGAGSCREGS